MSLSELQLLRLYLADPEITPGQGASFSDDQLQSFLDNAVDEDNPEYAAAAEGWRIKMGTVAVWYNVQLDGAMLSMGDAFKHAQAMTEVYDNLSGGGVSLGNTQLVNTFDSTADPAEEFAG